MDKIRFLLISAIVFVGFYGFIQFTEFKKTKEDSRQAAATEQAPIKTDLPSQHTRQAATDLPVRQDISSLPEKKQAQSQWISVHTDNFTLRIDKEGGDIIYLALNKQTAELDKADEPFVLLQENSVTTYIATSGLIGQNGTDSSEGRPIYQTTQDTYRLEEGQDKLLVNLTLDQTGVKITKQYQFTRNDYLIGVEYFVDNQTNSTWQAAFYGQIKRDNSKAPTEATGMGMSPYLGFATRTSEDRFKKIGFDDLDKSTSFSEQGGWVAMIQHYFLSAWVFDDQSKTDYRFFKSSNSQLNVAEGVEANTAIEPNTSGSIKASFYAGPKDQYELEKISEGLDLSVDYGFLWMIAQPLYALLYFINNGVLHLFGSSFDIFGGVGNWGFAIILLTIIVKLCFYSLNVKAYTSMAKMRAIQPKMLALKDRYGDDRQKMSQETMALYKKEGVNPLGGCLPMLVQMPVFIALYWVLMESVELRHAPFIGWIKDLSAMDPYFILPAVMGISMWLQQKMQPAPPDPMQAKVMQFLPIIFTFFFLFFPAGLVLYWVVNNIITIIQQWYITRKIEQSAT